MSVADSIAVLLAACSDAKDSAIAPYTLPDTYLGNTYPSTASAEGKYWTAALPFLTSFSVFVLSIVTGNNFTILGSCDKADINSV